MGGIWTPALIALFVWWFSTGVILMAVKYADRRGGNAHLWSVLLALPLLVLGLWGFAVTCRDTSVAGVYLAFLSALAIWGWIEMAFLCGLITGPNRRACPPGIREWERFLRAWGTIAWHEMLLVGMLITLGVLAWQAPNIFGLWTFAVLFAARISAKLNLFFGVPRINVEFLPKPLAHLPSHFRISAMNSFYPLSLTIISLAIGCWLERLYASATPAHTAGFALLTALTALALLEHWFMVLPLPDAKLWRWMLPKGNPATPNHQQDKRIREDAHGL